ncbi:hypothetical protein [Aquabacter cavernae]|uniref:hypothetical protein n=1 Tax=Aquabacter cavernae TaxID=2496029 RepID=UPI000F8CA79A|nr:hypothetical protein [Aquabacter cavernae]
MKTKVTTLAATALAAFAMLAAPGIAGAQDFPNTLNMTCAEATAMVTNQGAVTLSTGPNVFNRYVKDDGYCSGGQQTKAQWVQTRDQQQCPVGNTCVDPSNEGGGR